jgi:hypothetical protein
MIMEAKPIRKSTMSAVIACGRRLLQGPPEAVWSSDTREAVARALNDRADLNPTLEAAIESGKSVWQGSEEFRQWLEKLERTPR